MKAPEEMLREAGVSDDQVEPVLEAIERTTCDLLNDYDVAPEDPTPVVDVVQETILQTVVEFGEEHEDMTVTEQFEMLQEDFESPNSTSARSNVVYALGMADPPEHLERTFMRISSAVVADNYT